MRIDNYSWEPKKGFAWYVPLLIMLAVAALIILGMYLREYGEYQFTRVKERVLLEEFKGRGVGDVYR